ncbi:unnamed protein product [Paramecium octaurelia]|uniref:MORN repeat-containing protein n=1 Tax=Paramecium octaurelia TaxID=43137 RepID=A0A8S1WIZ2_PAROT|nr:unnamed protein product [Paramecium octaurelia]
MMDQHTYIGDWSENKLSGYRVYTWPDGRRCEGQWNNSQMSEEGSIFGLMEEI